MGDEMSKQIRNELFDYKELITKLKDMDKDDRRFYRDAIILTILTNTTDTVEEALGALEIQKSEIIKKYVKDY